MSSFSVDNGGSLTCDLQKLLTTKLLIQANSGGGKSWAVRRVLEQTHKSVQQIVLDPEGEFASLREKYDYVYVAKVDGDAVAHPRSAALLAERLLELGVSAIVDLFELLPADRVRFVRFFLEALVNAPKRLWHPVLVVLDEAHAFAPEKGQAESASAVIALCSLGRKRGFCAVLATQRIQKLSKDAAAECNNKMIGRTTLDIDMDRAASELGFGKARVRELKDLDPGQFFVEGPAFSQRGVVMTKVGKVATTHPEAGRRRHYVTPPPTSKIRALLPKLSDLPAEADERAKTVEDLRAEVAKLRREMTLSKRESAEHGKTAELRAEVAKLNRELAVLRKMKLPIRRKLQPLVHRLHAVHNTTQAALGGIHGDLVRILNELEAEGSEPQRESVVVDAGRHVTTRPIPATARSAPATRPSARASESSTLPDGERAILTAIAQTDGGVDMAEITILTGYKKSTRNTYIHRLRGRGYVDRAGDRFVATSDGLDALGSGFEPLPSGAELRAYWQQRLPEGERKIFDLLTDCYPSSMRREAIDEATGFKKSTRNTYVTRLAARKLIISTAGEVAASARLF